MSPPRKFDHDQAKRMRAAGMTYAAIAAELGVSATAVAYVCNPATRNAMDLYHSIRQRSGSCIECGAPCSHNPYGGHKGRCRPCAAAARASSVRDDALQCVTCREWKRDTEFPCSRSREGMRRGRHSLCRACNTEAKRQWRLRSPEKVRAAAMRDAAAKKDRRRKAAA